VPRPRPRSPLLVCSVVAVALLAGAPAAARASISAAVAIDGPSGDVIGLDGVAMAPDGTGGLVYRKRADGRIHVFVARYTDGTWQAPQRVDAGQRYDSSWPAIGAGDGGRLVVTWIHQFGGGVQNRLYAASLDPGAKRFQAPVAIDLDVREGIEAAPSLSMNRGGVAYLVYRVVLRRQAPDLPPGTVDADYRIQRYSGSFWSPLGQPLDRVQTQPQATPTALNGPQVATDATGNAVVAWQEPDDQLIPRVYARRVFGQVLGNVLQASPGDVGGVPLRAAADQLSLAVAPFGEAIVGMRQQPDPLSPWTRQRLLVNMLPSSLAEGAGAFVGARPLDGGGADGLAGSLGPVAASVDDDGGFDAAFALDGRVLGVSGDETAVGEPQPLGAGGAAPDPLVAHGREGSLAVAWKLDLGVGLLERRVDGTPFERVVAAPGGGVVQTLRMGGSELGSALVGFLQAREGGVQIAAASIVVPPGRFTAHTPPGWVRARRVALSWDAAPSTSGPIAYDLQVDGEDVATGLRRLRRVVGRDAVGDGNHEIAVVATDALGQTATSVVSRLKIDRTGPRADARRLRGRRVALRVHDGPRGEGSGVTARSVRIAWGDGTSTRGRRSATHRYADGAKRIVVTAKDRAGNKARRTVVLQ
jgi:hypothetical protein